MLHGYQGDVLHPDLFKDYFRLFYGRIPPDKADIQRLLTADGIAISFRTAADRFKLIDDGWQETVFVSYGEEGATLLDQLRRHGPERWLMRKLQRYAVSINKKDRDRLQRDGFLDEPWPGIYLQIRPELYDDCLGLILEPQHSVEGFVC
jgi:CRISPR-associated endonuclease/helicase Cas3